MAKKGKKYQEAANKVDRTKYYSVEEAIKLAKETSIANFDASVEVAFRLGIDTVSYTHLTLPTKRIV